MLTFNQLMLVILVLSILYYSKNYQEPFRMIVGQEDHYAYRDISGYQTLNGQK